MTGRSLTKEQLERLKSAGIEYPWNPWDILKLLDELYSELDSIKRCSCNELLFEYGNLGKCMSSSCEIHEWGLVNRLISLETKCKQAEAILKFLVMTKINYHVQYFEEGIYHDAKRRAMEYFGMEIEEDE